MRNVDKLIKTLLIAVLSASPIATGASDQQEDVIEDRNVEVLQLVPPIYPPEAHSLGVEGVVVVKVKIDAEGNVAEAVALSGNRWLTPYCARNAKKWHFLPNNLRAAILVYDFRIKGYCHDNTELGDSVFHAPNFTTVVGCSMIPVH